MRQKMDCVALSYDGGNNEGSRKIWRGEAGQTMDRSGLQCEVRSVACVVRVGGEQEGRRDSAARARAMGNERWGAHQMETYP
jgi:hypothetical protein